MEKWLKTAVGFTMLFAATLALATSVLGQSTGGFSFSPLVLPGTPSPDGGNFFPSRIYDGRVNGSRAFNSMDEVGIAAETFSPCIAGRFLVSSSEKVWLLGFCPAAPGGANSLLGAVNLNERGDAVVLGGPTDSENFIDPTITEYSAGQFSIVAKNGDPTTGGRTDIGPLSKKCIFGEPFINNNGDVSFWGCTVDDGGMQHFGIFSASGGKVSVIASDFDPAPIPGTFAFGFFPSLDAIDNDNGSILFQAGVSPEDASGQIFGLFISNADGIKKIIATGDILPGDLPVRELFPPVGMLNNNGDVAFCVKLDNPARDSGIFLYSAGGYQKIVGQGDSSPIGGLFGTFDDASLGDMVLAGLQRPELNDRDEIVFKAKSGPNGNTPGLFMASPSAIAKIVAVGDVLPNGERIGEIKTYALNQAGQVAFFAYRRKGELGPLGVWVASPVAPTIKKAKLKGQPGSLRLIVKGNGFITNDSVIEINRTALGSTAYPAEFQQNGGTTTRLISTDARLDQLVPPGSTVQVTVLNRLTGLVSSAFSLTR